MNIEIRKETEQIRNYVVNLRKHFHQNPELSLEECRRLWLHNTRAYAKRQRTWFRARSEARFFAPQDLDGLLAAARQAC